ncbi:MAG: hypothetical protein RIE06_31235 [Roseibium album]|uniref:hypothetical protein n=1 Tax=Roseibium album TaxID=311410 RepID=UPI0032EC4494
MAKEIVLRSMFPYGMEKNPDGSWTIFNRNYKPLGVISKDWEEWDVERHKVRVKGLGPVTLKRLHVYGGKDDAWFPNRVYFYEDACVPTRSAKNMEMYLEKMKILMRLIEA